MSVEDKGGRKLGVFDERRETSGRESSEEIERASDTVRGLGLGRYGSMGSGGDIDAASCAQQPAATHQSSESLVNGGPASHVQQFFGGQRRAFRQRGSMRQNLLGNGFHEGGSYWQKLYAYF